MRVLSATSCRCRAKRRGSRGFTLVEMLLSVAIMATLMGTMVVSLAVASRAIDDGAGPVGQTRRAAEIVEEMDADLSAAVAFSERTASAVTFSVPDRDGDGDPETIRYSWTGDNDRRLLRQVNGGEAVVIAEDVRQFNLTYRLRTVASDDGDDGGDGGGRGNGRGWGRRDRDDKGDRGKRYGWDKNGKRDTYDRDDRDRGHKDDKKDRDGRKDDKRGKGDSKDRGGKDRGSGRGHGQ